MKPLIFLAYFALADGSFALFDVDDKPREFDTYIGCHLAVGQELIKYKKENSEIDEPYGWCVGVYDRVYAPPTEGDPGKW